MKKLQDLKQEFLNFPSREMTYTNAERKYIVVSHFVGKKDVNEILTKLAIKQAYCEI